MKKHPLPVVLVSILFILTGCIGFAYHVREFFDPSYNPYELIWTLIIRILAVVSGVFLFYGFNWARWLAIIWLIYHVVLSAFHTTSELIMHIVFLLLVSILLFIPVSSRYFRNKKQ
jgi:hypothetical protein